MTFLFLGHLKGLGIGTILEVFTTGKAVEMMGNWLDHRFQFVFFLSRPCES